MNSLKDPRLAKQKKNDPSLFDAIESNPAASVSREGAIRSALLGGNGAGTDVQIALHEAAQLDARTVS